MITQFAIRLICGMSIVWCVMPRHQVTSGFFRIQLLVTLGLSVLAAVAAGELAGTVISGQPHLSVPSIPKYSPEAATVHSAVLSASNIQVLMGLTAVLSFVGSIFWTLERRVAGGRFCFAIAAISTTCAALSCVSQSALSTMAGSLYWMSEVATGLVSGAAVGGMLLGHWYLTAPTMSTSPLNKINTWFAIAAGFRLLLAGTALIMDWSIVFQSEPIQVVVGGAGLHTVTFASMHSIWLSLEWLGGIIGPLIVCLMVHRIMKYRNTQAATGVLFVGVILAFLGEMTAALLRRELQLPL